mgnify:CR=1 FL=1
MQGWIIYNKRDAIENKSYIEWFIYECKKQDIQLTLLYREQLTIGLKEGMYVVNYENKPISLPDFIVIRTIEPLLQNTFEALFIPTFNSFEVAYTFNHKSRTYIEMHRLGIPLLPTFFTTKSSFPTNPPLSYPFVIKEATGRGGKQVYYIENEKDWKNVEKLIQSEDIIIQDANVQLGKDVRVFVVGREIVAAVLRKNYNDFRANYKLGGSAQLFHLTEAQKVMVQKIIDHFNFGLVGIDFLIGHDNELLFNEIEDVVGSRILSATTEINLLEKYVSLIKQTVIHKKAQITS